MSHTQYFPYLGNSTHSHRYIPLGLKSKGILFRYTKITMTTKINIIYSLAEDNLTASEVERLISELETLQEIKEKQENTSLTFA